MDNQDTKEIESEGEIETGPADISEIDWTRRDSPSDPLSYHTWLSRSGFRIYEFITWFPGDIGPALTFIFGIFDPFGPMDVPVETKHTMNSFHSVRRAFLKTTNRRICLHALFLNHASGRIVNDS